MEYPLQEGGGADGGGDDVVPHHAKSIDPAMRMDDDGDDDHSEQRAPRNHDPLVEQAKHECEIKWCDRCQFWVAQR